MRDIGELISSWQQHEPTSPRLTWYGSGDERVELSGRVLANWAIKAANLLIEEADADPEGTVLIDLPVHWRALVWSLGTWLSGAQVHFGARIGQAAPPVGRADVLITDDVHAAPEAEVLIAVALPALAMAFDEELPEGAVDGAADLMTYPDELIYPPAPTDLSALAQPLPATEVQPRVLLPVPGRSGATIIGQCLGIWLAGGSVVLLDDERDAAHLAGTEEAALW